MDESGEKLFATLLGGEHSFYGVDNECFKLGRRVFEAMANEDDGYRSYLGSLEVRDKEGLIFFRRPLARVRIVECDNNPDFDGYRFVDLKDGHVWLRFGTDYADDYYPMFVFEYQPKRGA